MSPRASDRDPALDQKPDQAPEPTSIPDGPDSEWIRVKDLDTGLQYSTTRALAIRAGATYLPGKPALDRYDNPLPPKPYKEIS